MATIETLGTLANGTAANHTSGYWLALALVGIVAGLLSGLLGIGSGVLIIPALIFIFGFPQDRAIGTSLTMLLPPVGIFAFMTYYRAGKCDVPAASAMAATFAFGAWGGAYLVSKMTDPQRWLRPLFVIFLLYVAGNMLFRSERRVAWAFSSVLKTLGLIFAYVATFFILRLLGKRWERSLSVSENYRQKLEKSLPPDYEI